jgi:formamidopyrimidine-DNA glycosylase
MKAVATNRKAYHDYFILEEVEAGTFQLYHRVYRKRGQPCPLCGTPIERITVDGRGTHFCPKCQKISAGS